MHCSHTLTQDAKKRVQTKVIDTPHTACLKTRVQAAADRKVAGIAPYTQKPYLYYNGEIKAFGQTMARVTKFNITGKNNITQHWVVKGADITMNETTDQVPFALAHACPYMPWKVKWNTTLLNGSHH